MWTFRENRYADYMLLCTQFAQFTLHYFHYFIKLCRTTCRKKHNERVTSEAKWLRPEKETQPESASEQETERFVFKST